MSETNGVFAFCCFEKKCLDLLALTITCQGLRQPFTVSKHQLKVVLTFCVKHNIINVQKYGKRHVSNRITNPLR